MSRKDNAGVQVRKSQKEEFVRLARERKTTQTRLFGDMLKLATMSGTDVINLLREGSGKDDK